MSKRAKIGFGGLVFLFIGSLILNGFFSLVYLVDHQIGPNAREARAMRVVEQLDEASRSGLLAQFDVSDVQITGKPRLMTSHTIGGVRHEMVIVGSDDWYVELYFIDSDLGQMFVGEVYAAHHVRVGCCAEGEDRWWVANPDLLSTYIMNE